ncbi:MAG: metallophosphoesterase [Pirellulales bacterium]|nr:metallophosphoesterase [Pirellulales bacterium]
MAQCYFVSDLHLFANRSKAEKYLEEMSKAAARADYFVLGGDIFDFCWARTGSHSHTVAKAVGWLRALLEPSPRCEFHYVLGNHDFHHQFVAELEEFDRTLPNFSLHRYYVRLGSNLFMHGDVADREDHDARSLAAARDEWLDAPRRGPFMSRLYDVVVLARLHKPVPHLVFSKRTVARRILKYLEEIGQGPAAGVKDVYFGHTHKAMKNYRHGGIVFHNGGVAIKGMKFRILEANVE